MNIGDFVGVTLDSTEAMRSPDPILDAGVAELQRLIAQSP